MPNLAHNRHWLLLIMPQLLAKYRCRSIEVNPAIYNLNYQEEATPKDDREVLT